MENKQYSLLTKLGVIIITLVVSIMIINSTYNYQKTKSSILKEMKDDSKESILSIKSNISILLASYSPNEYGKIINNELKDKDIFAIVIKDYNLGKVLGKNVYISGRIKNKNSIIEDYDDKNEEQNRQLANSFFSNSSNITDSSNNLLGTIAIYLSDSALNEELDTIIYDTIINTIFLSVLLILFLYLSIKYYILKPISNIIDAINNDNSHGIPNKPIPYSKSTEINELSSSINKMILSIKDSRSILEKSQHRLEYLLDLSPISIRITKKTKKNKDYVIFANGAYSKLLQVSKDNVYGMDPKDYYINKTAYENIEKELLNGNSIYNMTMEVKINNKQVYVLASYMNIEYDGENAIIGWFYDITNEKENEANLHKALELQTTIFDNSGYMIISTNINGVIQQFNKEAERILGYKAKEVVNIHTPLLFHLKSEIKQRKTYLSKELNINITSSFEVFSAKTDLGLKNENEWTVISKNGEHIPVLITITALKNKDNETYGYIGICQDISQRKLLESQSKLASMGEMIGNIAHQWRQPLSMISTIASGILIKNELVEKISPQIVSDMEKIMGQTNYLSQTIDDFRNFIKNTNQKEKISIVETIEKALTILKPSINNNHINLITKFKDDCEIEGFQNQIIQAFINIINNAKDAIKERLRDNEEKLIFIETQKINNQLILVIKDNAGGIDDTIMHKVFEPYFTTKHKSIGTGIGLSMSHQIITEYHDASIEVFNSTYTYDKRQYIGAYFQITFNNFCDI
jgi:PAS domain S-box-containing protein|tara:strand:- start:17772 stop:20027 length:2256 start_codon:yes stop_codon:yes gene_type:complete